MKRLLVVMTCDGPCYFHMKDKDRAIDMATEQVLRFALSTYDSTDRERVLAASESGNRTKLWKVLLDRQAIQVAYFQ